MVVLPPGTLLQLLYLKERLIKLPAGNFIEIGPGSGEITALLLELGWRRSSFDLMTATTDALGWRFADVIRDGSFQVRNTDFITAEAPDEKVDLIISCMVMEHLDDAQELQFMQKACKCLKPGGIMISLVPASPQHWGIEDDIAGHFRRYSRKSIGQLMEKSRWRLKHIAGLTFPVSNLLLPVSNFLVKRAENSKLKLSKLERTKQSGNRNVKFKTHFPPITGLLLNRLTILPFYWVQKTFLGSKKALVLYFEATPLNSTGHGMPRD